jgi:hypothetical protein
MSKANDAALYDRTEAGREPTMSDSEYLKDRERGDAREPFEIRRRNRRLKVIAHISSVEPTPKGLEHLEGRFLADRVPGNYRPMTAYVPADGDGTWILEVSSWSGEAPKNDLRRVQRDWFTNVNTPAKSRAMSRRLFG